MQYGLIGEKLGHSYSKEIHEMLGRYSYELNAFPPEELEGFITSKNYLGLNVTIPYKEKVIPYLDHIDESAALIGAVNTIVNRDGVLTGYNTDFYGMKSLIEKMGIRVEDSKALILGSGGTSKTARGVLKSLGASEILVASRRGGEGMVTYDEVASLHTDASVIINTTPVGMFPNAKNIPIDLDIFTSLDGVVDAIYNPNRTELVLAAEKKGVKAEGGLYMLVMQAVKAAEFFTGEPVPAEVSDEVYRKIAIQKKNLVLTGMPGSGKSTIGKIISEKENLKFVDTDALIVEKEGRSISDIFATDGEKYFRDVEAAVIDELSLESGLCISTGGGAVLREDNVKALSRNGVIFFIDRKPESLVPTADRPLADTDDKMVALYNTRLPIYKATADNIIINNDIDTTIDKIDGLWRE